MKNKKYLISLLAVLAFCGILEGCKNQEIIQDNSVTDMEWYINFSWFTTSWGGNEVSRAITDITETDIRFLTPKGDGSEKLNAMIASDTLPDLITLEWWEPQNRDMIDKGQVYALNELADKYDPGFYDVLDEKVVEWYRLADGNFYSYHNSFFTPEDFENGDLTSNQNFMVRKDIYEAIGSPDMTSPEGFMEAVRAAARMFPEVDGEPLIPIGADEFTDTGNDSFGLYLHSFLAVPYEKDGRFYDRNTDSDYLKWLKVFRDLGEEGYLKGEIFVDKRSQLEKRIEKGQYFCLFYQSTDVMDSQRVLYNTKPDSIYIAVDGPRNEAGDNPRLPTGGIQGWTSTYISKNCRNPEKALRLLKYLISEEGQKMTCLGVEGSMYKMQDGVPVMNKEVTKLLARDRKAYDEKYGADNAYWMLQNNVMQQQWIKEKESPVSQMQEWTKPYTVYVSQYEINPTSDSQFSVLYDRQQRIWGETLPRLLLAEREEEFDRILQEYLVKRTENGYEEYAEKLTQLYKKNKEKLGLTEESTDE